MTELLPIVQIKWDGSTFTDESLYLQSLTLNTSVMTNLQAMSPQAVISSGKMVLSNNNYRFSPRTGVGVDTAVHSYLLDFPPNGFEIEIYLDSDGSFPGDYKTFTGRVIGYNHDETRNTVSFTVAPVPWLYVQRSDSTVVYEDYHVHDLLEAYMAVTDITSYNIEEIPIEFSFAWLNSDNVWTDMKSISDATLSYLWPDDDGALTFQGFDTWYPPSAVGATFSPDANYTDMRTSLSAESLYTDISVEYSPRDVGTQDVLFRMTERLKCPADVDAVGGVSVTHILKTQKPIYVYNTPVADVDYGVTLGAGVDAGTNVTVGFEVFAQEIRVTITNEHESLEAVLEWFNLTGVELVGNVSRVIEKNIETISGFKRDRPISLGFYGQKESHAQWVANVMEQRLGNKDVGVTISDVPVDSDMVVFTYKPLVMGTCIEYQRHNDSATVVGYVVGCTLKYTDGKLSMDLTVINGDVLYQHSNYAKLYSVPGTFSGTEKVFC